MSLSVYLRSLQAADDVEGCVRVLVHLQEEEEEEEEAGEDMHEHSWHVLH